MAGCGSTTLGPTGTIRVAQSTGREDYYLQPGGANWRGTGTAEKAGNEEDRSRKDTSARPRAAVIPADARTRTV
ncbi:unnamed protein product [Nezara viridula]|uniref:Uncharacterized protein n=1 Tax=Nezara viridula TaxID=85310 RepID=A0A9P0MSQ2_NEZVI|nr:unnamed protein product [Nezara viridula]